MNTEGSAEVPAGEARETNATRLGRIYDDALLYARAYARKHGYALARHGSEVRDLDLIAVPWAEDCSDAETLAVAIRDAVHGAFTHGDPADKPHGRLSWAIHLPCPGDLRDAFAASGAHFDPYIDLAVMPTAAERTRLEARLAEVEAERDEALAALRHVNDVEDWEARTLDQNANDRLRAAVRPLVEAAIRFEEDCPDFPCRIDEMTERESAIANVACDRQGAILYMSQLARAALADPAIAALLDQQKEQG